MPLRDERELDEQAAANSETAPIQADSTPGPIVDGAGEQLLPMSGMGSGLLAQQPTPRSDDAIAVAKICPQCGAEYKTGDRFCPRDGSPLRPKAGGDPLIGRVIADRYLVLARLGEGGMGRVYLAEHVKMTRQCAIKVMNPSLMHDAESLARFAREASSAARILHPNVAAVFDYGEADKIVYLVMEYVNGESLSAILAQNGALAPRRAIDIARQIADGLSAAHELGIVHRDLKPDNVIVASSRTGRETPKVVDFGIAKALSDSPQDALTRSGLVIGTPEYMSPEQLLGDPVDARADIYSLGCILYQMLTGAQPFSADSREQMIRRRLHDAPPHVRDVLPSLPRRLDTLIVHMLARSSSDRLSSAAEARDALDPALALSGWDPSMISDPRPTPETAQDRHIPADPSLQPTAPMPRQRTSLRRIAVGAVAGSAVLIGALLVRSRRELNRPTPAVAHRLDTANALPEPASVDTASLLLRTLPPLSKADSVAPKPKPDSAAMVNAAVTAPLERFRIAAKSGKIASVMNAFPMISSADHKFFEDFFASAEDIRAKSTVGNPVIYGNDADVSFRLLLTYLDRKSKSVSSVPLRYHAFLHRAGKKWSIRELRPP